ncbi:MAG: alpha-glucuronidase family glycosyl hydrolase, partial [Clostridiales bacterium]
MYTNIINDDFDKCWLNYRKINNKDLIKDYENFSFNLIKKGNFKILNTALEELITGLDKMLNQKPIVHTDINDSSGIIIGKFSDLCISYTDILFDKDMVKNDGYLIKTIMYNNKKFILISANKDIGILYGTYHFLRLIQMELNINNLSIVENSSIKLRMLNHWDNIDGTIERGYSGNSIFFCNDIAEPNERILYYARLLSSIGINSITLNNVNVRGEENYFITEKYLYKINKLANVFRCFGIKIYLSINFASPVKIGNLENAD